MARATVSKQPESSNVDDREDFKNPKEAIPRLARQAVDAGATLKEVAAVLKTDEASVGKILGITPQDATKIEFFVKPGDEFDTDFDKTPSMFKQVVDRARYALESRELPDVSVDKPDVTLTDLMAQSKPSLPSVSIPERPSVAKPDTTLAPVRKDISPMGTYGMTREEFEAARGPRIGDVKRSDIGGVLKDVDISESLKAKINAFAELNQKLSEASKPDVVNKKTQWLVCLTT